MVRGTDTSSLPDVGHATSERRCMTATLLRSFADFPATSTDMHVAHFKGCFPLVWLSPWMVCVCQSCSSLMPVLREFVVEHPCPIANTGITRNESKNKP